MTSVIQPSSSRLCLYLCLPSAQSSSNACSDRNPNTGCPYSTCTTLPDSLTQLWRSGVSLSTISRKCFPWRLNMLLRLFLWLSLIVRLRPERWDCLFFLNVHPSTLDIKCKRWVNTHWWWWWWSFLGRNTTSEGPGMGIAIACLEIIKVSIVDGVESLFG